MEQIYSNLGTLTWWFNILFPITLVLIIQKLLKVAPNKLTSFKRKQRLYRLRIVKNMRRDSCAINYEVSKANGRFVVFVLSCVCFIAWFSSQPAQELFGSNSFITMIATIPIYVFEVIWLTKVILIDDLIEHRSKLRTKHHVN